MADAAASPRSKSSTKIHPKGAPKIYLKATADHVAKDKHELSFKKGDILKYKGQDDSGWFEGAHKGETKTGFFPGNLVVEVTADGVLVVNSQFGEKKVTHGVVTDSSVAHKKETKDILAKHLENRPAAEELINRHIYEPSKLSPELYEAQKKLEQAKTKDFLANFLRSKEQNREPLMTEAAVTEFILQMADPKTGIPHGKHTKKLTKSYENCFTGKQARDWLINSKHCEDKDSAVATMSFLLNSGVFRAVNNKVKIFKATRLYRLTLNAGDTIDTLNTDKTWHSATRNALDLSSYLMGIMLELIAKFKRPNGSVDFDTLRRSDDFKKVTLATAELQKVDLSKISDADKLPFWLNVSNLLTLHTHCKRGVPSTMLARRQYTEQLKYVVAGHEYSQDDIQHIIFRGVETPAPETEMLSPRGTKPVTPRAPAPASSVPDPRMKESLHLQEKPMWIFGLSDGTNTTPFFTVFTAHDFDKRLLQHAQEFVRSHTVCNHDSASIIYPYALQRLMKEVPFTEEKLHAFVKPLLEERDQALFDKVAEFGGKIGISWTSRDFGANYLPDSKSTPKLDTSAAAAAAAAADK